MKYLFFIIRHCFPRKRWKEVAKYEAKKTYFSGKEITNIVIELRDQFGNIKKVSIP